MRPLRLATAALAALALAAAGCDLVSSLTPFGLGERGADESGTTYTGAWNGTTTATGTVTFTVTRGNVNDLVLTHTLACGLVEEFTFTEVLPIRDGAFSGLLKLTPQGNVTVSGRFTAPDSASGTYGFSSLATSAQCQNSGGGSFAAEKAPLLNP